MRRLALAFLVAALAATLVRADEPPPAPETTTMKSRNGKFVAISEPKTDVTTGYKLDEKGEKTKLWELKGWVRYGWLADDGEHFLVGYAGANLLSKGFKKNETMLTIYKSGTLVTTVTLDQLVKDQSNLKKTVSHWRWGDFVGLDEKGRFVVSTVEGKEVVIEVATGKILETRDAKK